MTPTKTLRLCAPLLAPLLALTSLAAPPEKAETPASTPLPIHRVVLYKHGVGYFERKGTVKGSSTLTLAFKAGEMNDVLKSLTLLDLSGGKGRVSSVAYDSTRPLERLLADYPFDLRLEGGKGLATLLPQVQGAEIQVTLPSGSVTGLVIGVEKKQKKDGEKTFETMVVSLLTQEGSIRTIDLSEVVSLEPTDPKLRADLKEYLEIVFASRRKDQKRLTIQADGEGERQIYASYIVEAPVWKASYRAILPDKNAPEDGNGSGAADSKKPLLQGWALVDNTSDEDWNDVELSLVSGRPVSFVLDLYDPRYKRRPVVEIEEEIAATPQTHEGAIETARPPEAPAERKMAAPSPGAVPQRETLGRAAGKILRRADASADKAGESIESYDDETRFAEAAAAGQPEAVAREIGELFEYHIDHHVTIPKNRSSLIPILSAPVEGERVSVFNQSARSDHPLNALRFKNTSKLTLEGGPVTVLEGDTYAGEALLETLKPDETRFLSYAVDLGCHVSTTFESSDDRVDLVKVLQGNLVTVTKRISTCTYAIANVLPEEKTVWVEHPRRRDWTLREGAAKPDESSESYHRFKIRVAPKATAKLAVVEESPAQTTVELTSLTSDQVDLMVRKRLLSDEMRALLEKVLALHAEIAGIDAAKLRSEAERKSLFEDQSRLRANLQALRDTAEEKGLRSRYIAQFQTQEDRIAALDDSLRDLAARRDKAQAELLALVRNATLEFRP